MYSEGEIKWWQHQMQGNVEKGFSEDHLQDLQVDRVAVWSFLVMLSPQSRAKNPPPLPLAAAATFSLSTINGFTPRRVK
jgi:hypothetical protein